MNLRKRFIFNRTTFLGIITVLCCTGLGFVSCSHYDELKRNVVESRNGSEESHEEGRNCMNCHKQGGEAAREDKYLIWNIGGTVYESDLVNTHPNGKLFLYTKPNRQGQLKYVLEIDTRGNVYTNQIINFSGGLYPYIVNSAGEGGMTEPITNGQCGSCHGVSTQRIYTF